MGIYARIAERIERQARLMGGMMERLEIDPAEVARHSMGMGLERAVRSCLSCASPDVCEKWQAETVGSTVAHAPGFCPNAPLFETYLAK